MRQVCHALSTAMLCVSHSPPLDFACTVVAEGQLPLPYHSMMSSSPSPVLPSQNAGQAPAVRQLNLIRASQVWPAPPSQTLASLAL
ncbi:hypothetical protein AFA91_13985 [Mycolicibacterium goodii]|uniref:Uncharacterized protein n=1 Tax=Mycolicibacterium goodii TaxID=134601 RepID=A0A0K0X5X6_MYCGD|nr:hypothetical protein AFA91_13985 [Mycolicibacterium goodii]